MKKNDAKVVINRLSFEWKRKRMLHLHKQIINGEWDSSFEQNSQKNEQNTKSLRFTNIYIK